MTLCKSRTSYSWNHSSELHVLVNQDDHATPIRSPVGGQTGFSKSRGVQASIPFFPLPHPPPSTFWVLPNFLRSPNSRNSFPRPTFCSCCTGMLVTQANDTQIRLHVNGLMEPEICLKMLEKLSEKLSNCQKGICHDETLFWT